MNEMEVSMLFKNLNSGGKFIFPESVWDETVSVYMKLEHPMRINTSGSPITATKIASGALMSVPDEAEVIVLAL